MPSMHITINTIELCTDIPDCMTADQMRKVTLEDKQLCALAELLLCNCPSTKTEVKKELQPYLSSRYEIEITDGTAVKGRIIIIIIQLG